MPNRTYVGMMSGTSADGVDAALVEFAQNGQYQVLATLFKAYPQKLKIAINRCARTYAKIDEAELATLDQELAEFYAASATELLIKNNMPHDRVEAIANHGQTIKHEPNASPPISIQLGNPSRIAQITNIRTIACFRARDLEVGGQGAPLMPAFHARYFASSRDRMVINIGGIANITLVPANAQQPVLGYDTGPGNTLMDQWIFQCLGDSYDDNGTWAESGQDPDSRMLSLLREDPYFKRRFPKSTGPDYFNMEWLNAKAGHLLKSLSPEIVQRTLCELTAISIAEAVQSHQIETVDVLVCGGGAHNSLLMRRLQDLFPNSKVGTTDEVGLPVDWVEATGFAWLGYCYDNNEPSNLPSVTGARSAEVLGQSFNP